GAPDVELTVHYGGRRRDDLVPHHAAPDLVAERVSARARAPGEHLARVPAGVHDAVRERRRREHVGLGPGAEVLPERLALRLAASGRGVDPEPGLQADVDAAGGDRGRAVEEVQIVHGLPERLAGARTAPGRGERG